MSAVSRGFWKPGSHSRVDSVARRFNSKPDKECNIMKAMIRVRLLVLVAFCVAGGPVSRGQDTFGSLESPHFEMHYQHGVSAADAKKVLDFLQAELKNITSDLGIEFKSKIEVRIYESVGKFLAETNLRRPWRTAYYRRGVLSLQPVSALETRKLFEKSLSYELSLAVLEQAGQNGCPEWLMQSFAVYYSGEISGMTPPLGAHLASFSDLNQDIQERPNPPQRNDVHYILGSTMTFLVEKYGEKRAFQIFREFDGVSTVDKVFKKAFNEDYATIEKAWAKYIELRTSSFH
jgi:hypothetical protein